MTLLTGAPRTRDTTTRSASGGRVVLAAAARSWPAVAAAVVAFTSAVLVLSLGAQALGVRVPLVVALVLGAAMGVISSTPVRRAMEQRTEGPRGTTSLAVSSTLFAALLAVLGLAMAVPAVCVTAGVYAVLLLPTRRRLLESLVLTGTSSAGALGAQALGWVDGVVSVPAAALFGAALFVVAAPSLSHVADTSRRAHRAAADLDEQRRRHLAEIEHAARHDPLTGLANRRGLGEQLRSAAREAAPTSVTALVCLDLSGFRAVNDVHGHDAGDELLREVARRLLAGVGPGDCVARTGGDEFVVVLRGLPGSGRARVVAERLRRDLSAPVDLAPGVSASVRVSCGVSCSSGDVGARDLAAAADAQLHLAKLESRPVQERLG